MTLGLFDEDDVVVVVVVVGVDGITLFLLDDFVLLITVAGAFVDVEVAFCKIDGVERLLLNEDVIGFVADAVVK
jgi:hypothetical protein